MTDSPAWLIVAINAVSVVVFLCGCFLIWEVM